MFGEEDVPRRAITMGVGTIMKARRIFLMAWGEGKAGIIKKTVEGEVREHIPATNLQNHPDTVVILDDAASEKLMRVDRKSTRLNSSHVAISYAVFCLKKKKNNR